MKNIDRIVAQAREWAAQACALVDMDSTDLSSDSTDASARAALEMLDGAGLSDLKIVESALEDARGLYLDARWALCRPLATLAKDDYLMRAEGAGAALRGLLRLWTAAEGRPVSKFDARDGDGVRRGFLDCAAGLATVFSAPGGFTACKPTQHAARKGAQELFDMLVREEES